MTIQGFFLGILMSAAGFLILRFRFRVKHMFRGNNWFERKLGAGSTYLVLIIFSLLIMVLGIMVSFGFADDFFRTIFGPVLNSLGS